MLKSVGHSPAAAQEADASASIACSGAASNAYNRHHRACRSIRLCKSLPGRAPTIPKHRSSDSRARNLRDFAKREGQRLALQFATPICTHPQGVPTRRDRQKDRRKSAPGITVPHIDLSSPHSNTPCLRPPKSAILIPVFTLHL